jgi:SMC interacting uncharacterized protein involved in chromosome segregation
VNAEVENLKLKKLELTNKMNLTSDFEEKEELESQIKILQNQIETLEKFVGKK